MLIFLLLVLGQCVFVVAVVFVLKKLLDRELMMAALEKFESCKASLEIKEISVYSASRISDKYKGQIEMIRQRKFDQAKLDYLENAELKGGVVITLGDLLLDFSLATRLQNFWS